MAMGSMSESKKGICTANYLHQQLLEYPEGCDLIFV